MALAVSRRLALRCAAGAACGLWGLSRAQATLDIAQAREAELDRLSGLGPATTRRLLQERERQPFAHWDDLLRRVPGIGPHKAAQLSAQGLRIQGQAYTAPTARIP